MLVGQKTTFGKLLWQSVGMVVMLTEQMRQCGEANEQFVLMLDWLQEGACTDNDFSLLNLQVISVAEEDLSMNEWQTTPIIISENTVKDAINLKSTLAFTQQTHQTVQWFDVIDTYCGAKITDPCVCRCLLSQPSGKTGQQLGRIPIVLGMPVIVTQNLDIGGAP